MLTRHRSIVGLAALTVGLCLLTVVDAAGPLPDAAYKKAITADIAALNKMLNDGKPANTAKGSIKALSLVIAHNANHAGNTGVAAAAVKVAEAAAKKDWAGASSIAKTLADATGGSAPKDLHNLAKLDLADVMAPFTKAGLGLEKGIKDGKKAAPAADVAELIGVRSAALAEFTLHFPNDKATGANAAKWKKYSEDMLTFSKQIVAEAGKSKADPKAMTKLMSALDSSCASCHSDFRAD